MVSAMAITGTERLPSGSSRAISPIGGPFLFVFQIRSQRNDANRLKAAELEYRAITGGYLFRMACHRAFEQR